MMTEQEFQKEAERLREAIATLAPGERRSALEELLSETLQRDQQIRLAVKRAEESKGKLDANLKRLTDEIGAIWDRMNDVRLVWKYLQFDLEARRREARGQ